jgi:hypothetical protein
MTKWHKEIPIFIYDAAAISKFYVSYARVLRLGIIHGQFAVAPLISLSWQGQAQEIW